VKATVERRSCDMSGWKGECLAPAGVGVSGVGCAEGEGFARGTCQHCGDPVCSKCSVVTRRAKRGTRVRVCGDCWEERYEKAGAR